MLGVKDPCGLNYFFSYDFSSYASMNFSQLGVKQLHGSVVEHQLCLFGVPRFDSWLGELLTDTIFQ